MAIVIERNITIKNDTSTLDNPLYLYVGDGDITYLFTIKEIKRAATFGSINTTNLITEQASYGEVRIYKPDDSLVFTTRAEIIDDKLQVLFSYENVDQLTESGIHKLQIHLYDDDDSERNRFTIPPIDLHVLLPIGIDTAAIGEAKADYAMIRIVDDPIDSFLDDGSYNRKEWANGDIITSGQLNKIEEALYEINGRETGSGSIDIDTSNLATKDEIPTKVSQLTNDSNYITESKLANKGYLTDIPSEYITESALSDMGLISSTTITRIEFVDELPTTEEYGVLYIVKSE